MIPWSLIPAPARPLFHLLVGFETVISLLSHQACEQFILMINQMPAHKWTLHHHIMKKRPGKRQWGILKFHCAVQMRKLRHKFRILPFICFCLSCSVSCDSFYDALWHSKYAARSLLGLATPTCHHRSASNAKLPINSWAHPHLPEGTMTYPSFCLHYSAEHRPPLSPQPFTL